jgi:hypothetical protein
MRTARRTSSSRRPFFYSKRIKNVETFRVKTSPFFEIAAVLVRLDHVASGIVNAEHSIM